MPKLQLKRPEGHASRLTVRRRLILGFMAPIVMMAILGFAALQQASSLHSETSQLAEHTVANVAAVGKISTAITSIRVRQENLVYGSQAVSSRTLWLDENRNDVRAVDALFAAYVARAPQGQERQLITSAAGGWRGVKAFNDKLAKLPKQDATGLMVTQGEQQYRSLLQITTKLSNLQDRQAGAAAVQAHNTYNHARNTVLALVFAAIAIAIALSWLISRYMTRALRQLMTAADGISRGEVDQTIDVKSGDEFGELAGAFTRMVDYLKDLAGAAGRVADGDLTARIKPKSEKDQLGNAFTGMTTNLNDVIGRVTEVSGHVSSSAQQMAASSDETGRAMGEVATAISEVAAGSQRQVISLESADLASNEMNRSTESAAKQAQETRAAAEDASRLAQEGEIAVAGATEAMGAIREASEAASSAITQLGDKSQEIGGIVDTITTIAEQTNLLALNAAIEAARAGEQGRGFAVVADEVRKLAEQSQKAAEQIATIIDEIQSETGRVVEVVSTGAERTTDGAATVDQAREAFGRIGEAVETITGRFTEIATSIGQVAVSANKVRGDIGEIAAVAEQNSSSSQEVAASTQETTASTTEIAGSARELAANATELQELVSRFKVD
jgi:methyl-accepting chemotaxis protein